MALVDHLVYAVSDLDDGRHWFEDRTGVLPALGGAHLGMGTHNALASFGSSYLELIAPDPQQPDPIGPRPFGIDGLGKSGLAAFAVRPAPGETLDDLVTLARHAGHDPGRPLAMSRRRTDGVELTWRLTLPPADVGGTIPFLIDWGDTDHPSAATPAGLELIELTATHPEPGELRTMFEALGLVTDIAIERHDEPGLAATIRGPAGELVLGPAEV